MGCVENALYDVVLFIEMTLSNTGKMDETQLFHYLLFIQFRQV